MGVKTDMSSLIIQRKEAANGVNRVFCVSFYPTFICTPLFLRYNPVFGRQNDFLSRNTCLAINILDSHNQLCIIHYSHISVPHIAVQKRFETGSIGVWR
jgi:hypothetical protein